jgi:hypothetical protein
LCHVSNKNDQSIFFPKESNDSIFYLDLQQPTPIQHQKQPRSKLLLGMFFDNFFVNIQSQTPSGYWFLTFYKGNKGNMLISFLFQRGVVDGKGPYSFLLMMLFSPEITVIPNPFWHLIS